MADAEYSGLSLDVTASTSKAVSDLISLKSALKDILDLNSASKISEISRSLNSMKDINAGNTSKALESIKSISEYANNISSDQISKMTSMADAVSKLTKAGKGGIPNLQSQPSFQIPTSSFYTGKYTTSAQSMPISTFPKSNAITTMFSDANKQSVSDYNDRVSTLKNIASAASSGLRSMGNAIKTITRYTKSGISAIGDLGSSLKDKLFGGFIEAAKGIDHLKNSFVRIAMYRAVRELIKDIGKDISTGMQNTYFWAQATGNQFAASMDKIATASLYAKNSFGAMAAPLLNALSPAIDMIIDKFVALVNVINQVFSLMGGSGTWIKAIKYPTTYADAVGKAEKANKSFLASFDELNVIPAQSSNTTDYGGMFETQNISTDIKNMLNTADWTDLGKQFGDKLNAITDSADSWINNKFKPAIQTWSSRIATYLNGAVSSINFKNIGNTFADGLNAIVDGANNFMQKFKFYDFGKGIGDAVSAWFQRVNWNNIATYFSNKLNSFIDVVHGFVDGLVNDAPSIGNRIGTAVATFFSNIKWDNIRETLKTGLHTIADFMEGFFKGEDGSFSRFGSELSDTVKSVLENPDLSKIISGVGSFVNALVKILDDKKMWHDIGYQLGQAIGSIDWVSILQTAADAIGSALVGCLQGLFDSKNGKSFLAIVAAIGMIRFAFDFGKHKLIELAIQSFAGNIGDSLATSIDQKIGTGSATETAIKDSISAKGALGSLKSFLGEDVGTAVSTFKGSLDTAGLVITTFTATYGFTKWVLDQTGAGQKLYDWSTEHLDLFNTKAIDTQSKIDDVTANIGISWKNGSITSSDAITELTNNLSGATDQQKQRIESMISSIKNADSSTSSSYGNMSNSVSIASDSIGNSSYSINSSIGGIADNASYQLGSRLNSDNSSSWGYDMIEGFREGINNAKNWLFDTVEGVADWISGMFHFSTPDFGPLSDYESWMPDFMKGMANGINNNSYLVMDAVKELAGNMQKELSKNISLTATGSTSYVAQTAYSLQSQDNQQGNMMNSLLNMVNNSQSNSNRPIVVDNKLYLDGQPIYASVVKRNNDVVAQTGSSEILV